MLTLWTSDDNGRNYRKGLSLRDFDVLRAEAEKFAGGKPGLSWSIRDEDGRVEAHSAITDRRIQWASSPPQSQSGSSSRPRATSAPAGA